MIDWGVNATQLASNARTALNNLYSPSGTLARRSRRALAPGPPAWAANDYQYFVNIKVDSSELTDPLLIHVFVGPVPSSPVDWATADSLAGSHAAMAHTDGMMVGQVALSHRLDDLLTDHEPGTIVPYLSSRLGYRVQRLDGSAVSDAELPGSFKIVVVGQQVSSSLAEDHFPKYGPFVEYPDASKGLVGGLQTGEKM